MRKIFITIFIIVVLSTGTVFYIAATQWKSAEAVEAEIPQGAGVRSIGNILGQKGAIPSPKLFELLVRVRGKAARLSAGIYDFPAGSTLISVISKLENGEVRQYPVTVIEGMTIKEMAAAIAGNQSIFASGEGEKFLKLTHDTGYIARFGLGNIPSLEGFLFPDTYFMIKPLTADKIIKKMVSQFKEVWTSLAAAAAMPQGLNEYQIVTLASIIEKETGVEAERPVIASVFYNRLKLNMPLQSDPTIIYGLPDFNGNIRKNDISNPHPYNTYVHSGLPPGPICNPGKAALAAALNPARTDFLYFVSKNNGTHEFSKTGSEHSGAVRRYQLNSLAK